jgi:hypothetical protein
MVEQPAPVPARATPTFPWWLVLCLVGLDYFSTLAYLPSIAVETAGAMAPLAAAAVVVVTLLFALPVYSYVVGRSPHGLGATGLLDRRIRGWTGKLLLLVLLGFVAADFVITRTLSVANASVHLLANPIWQDHVDKVLANKDSIRAALPVALQGNFFDFWTEQLVLTVALSVLCFALWALLRQGFTRTFLRIGAVVVCVYLFLTGLIVGSCLLDLVDHHQVVTDWWNRLGKDGEPVQWDSAGHLALYFGLLVIIWFPQMALGLSGFELSMASAPLVEGAENDDPEQPRGRIRRTRWLMFVAALIMAVFMTGSVFAVTLLLPKEKLLEGGNGRHRALAYLAHGADGERLKDDRKADSISPLFGETFGTLYDLSTVAILCLAGASSALGMRDVVPHYLARYGMQLQWARQTGVILYVFNLLVLVVTIAFHASVSAQQWAYATSVLALLAGASVAAVLDVRARWAGSWLMPLMVAPFAVAAFFFLVTGALTTFEHSEGLAIALSFVLVTVVTAFVSRWMRSTELRFAGFTFADEVSEKRWEGIRGLDFQVLVPHRPGTISLAEKDQEIRARHRIAHDVPVIFVEVERGDPSDFMQAPLMCVTEEDGRQIIRVSHCASVAHVLAAMGLAFREVGRPPEIHFGWSDESPLAANLNFLFLGEGNVPWMVHALVRKAEPDPTRRPRVVIG